jgi:ABC-2 type transport system permease protein
LQSFWWCVQRELWAYRSLYLAPLAVGAVYLFAFLILMIAGLHVDPTHVRALRQPYDLAAGLIMGTTFILGFYYALDCLHSERRDRSILFWKSLPVSDMTTVLAKAFIPIVFLPLITFVMTIALQFIMLFIASGRWIVTGGGAAAMWQELSLGHMWAGLLSHLLIGHVLWYAPIYAYLLLVSAWAKRAPVLWAAIPPLAIGFGEKLAFGTTHFANMLGYRIAGGRSSDAMEAMHSAPHGGLGVFLMEPGLWIGLAFAAVFIYAAARMRRVRGPV